jgi:uncharacterized protein YndB with AHSA1/START domain
MRYADGPTVEVEVLVRAPAEKIWPLVSDIELPARFSSEFQGATWIDDGPRMSARFVGRNSHPAVGEWETTSYVVRCDPPRSFGWNVSDPEHPSASWWFDLEPQGDATLVRYGARLGPGPSGLTPAITAMPDKEERIIARRLEEHDRNMRATLDGIKQLAEEGR